MYEGGGGGVALPRTGSDEPVDMLEYSVASTFGPDGPDSPCVEEGDVCEGVAALPSTGGPGDVTGLVVDAPRDVIVECREIDRGT